MNHSACPVAALFEISKALQTACNQWKECRYGQCRQRQSCRGGPRGTARKTGGFAACTEEGKARLMMIGEQDKTRFSNHYYQTASPSEKRAMRLANIQQQLMVLKADMLAAKINNG